MKPSSFPARSKLASIAFGGLVLFIASHVAMAQDSAAPSQPSLPQAATVLPSDNQRTGPSLMVFPTLVLLEGTKRTEEILLTNRGSQSKRYRIQLVDKAMREDGDIYDVPENHMTGQLSAKPHLRFSPRQVIIQPNSSQTVRVMSRLPADAPDGEYRTHISFIEVNEPPATIGEDTETSNEFFVQLTTNFGVGIPLIIRKGELSATGDIIDPRIETIENRPHVVFTLTRQGNQSLIGDVSVRRNGVEVARTIRLPVYTSTDRRLVRIPVNREALAGESLTGTPLIITYSPLNTDNSLGIGPTLTRTFTP